MTKGKRRKAVRISREEALKRLEAISELLDEELREAILVEAALNSANDWFRDRPVTAYEVNCYKVIFNSLTRDLALRVSKLYDIGRRNLNSQDKASLPVMVHFLRQKRVQIT